MDSRTGLYLRDATLSGWFNKQTGELYDGFGAGPGDVVLDAGCGKGGFVGFLARSGAQLIVADMLEQNVADTIEAIKVRGGTRVEGHVTDCAPIPLGDASVSRVICTEVLEHSPEPKALLRELIRVAKPGALFLFAVPDPVIETVQLELAPKTYWAPPNHVRIFGRDEFPSLITGSGFTIERQGSYGFYQAVWWAMYWSCNVTLDNPAHPALQHLEQSWACLLDSEEGVRAKRALDRVMPKSQVIVARRPE